MVRTVNSAPAQRRRRLSRRLKAMELDAVLLTAPASVRYLSGFTGEDSYLVVGRRWAVLLTDGRFEEQARLEVPDVPAVIRPGRMSDVVRQAVVQHGVRRLGVEAESVTLAFHRDLGKALGRGRKLVPTEELVGGLRLTKDAEELGAIRQAIRAAEEAFRGLTARGARGFVGRTEGELAAELEHRMRDAGASAAAFPSIVAAGAHAALPHYRPGGTKVERGQAVLIDWGAVVDGYCSDLTRVVFAGRIPPPIGEVYEVVLRAQAAGIAAVRARRSSRRVDRAARDVIAGAGYADHFGHGLGHGIGLEIHEDPRVSPRTDVRLARGAVVTVEPGIYLPGVGGVRIEDDVLVENDRGEVLSSLPKDLQAMVLR